MLNPSRLFDRQAARTRRRRIVLSAIIPVAAIAVAASLAPFPIILINDTPSVPVGLWIASAEPIAAGRVVAFHAPPAALPFVRAHLSRFLSEPILKPVAAMPGDRICADERDGFSVNGRSLGRALATDHAGNRVPPWIGCKRLTRAEFGVFSTRIKNSYDSRYFGPITRGEIIAVYRPLWTWESNQ